MSTAWSIAWGSGILTIAAGAGLAAWSVGALGRLAGELLTQADRLRGVADEALVLGHEVRRVRARLQAIDLDAAARRNQDDG